MPRRSVLVALLCAPLLAVPAVPVAAAAAVAAPGGPGVLSRFDLARKDCVGTAANRTSKVWYTVAGGVLSDVYSPTVDNTTVQSMEFLVSDGRTVTDEQTRDTTYTVRALDGTGMSCEVTSTARSGRYRIVADYLTDPARDAVLVRVRLEPRPGTGPLDLYVRLDPSVNGNGGGGTTNGGADSASVDPATGALVASDPVTTSNAVNRDYAVPTSLALRADRPFTAASVGFAGTASDGLTQLAGGHGLDPRYTAADHGNVVGTARLAGGSALLALGFGRDAASAVATAGAAARTPYGTSLSRYAGGWRSYDAGLRRPPSRYPGLAATERRRLTDGYWLSTNVLKASEDKTFPGAVVASLASPWGQAVSAGDTPDGKPVYFGSYREVFSRDLYEAFTGLLADGDTATARSTVRFLFDHQQQADGRFPRNSLLNGRAAPDTGGDQLDESSYPVLMAWQAGLAGDDALWPHVRAAADFVVAHGPSFGNERWEEQSGYSPSTIAAEIAGLVAAGAIADRHGDAADARIYRATADDFQRSIKGWTVTTSGPYAPRYFLRLSRAGDPNAAVSYGLGNGSITTDQRTVVDAGFLELTRLGELPATDPDVRATLPVVDRVIGRQTPAGQGYYRYGTDAAGSEDGYGDCWTPDATSCPADGQPWPTTDTGSGHPWPVLSGERAEQRLATGDRTGAAALLDSMARGASGVGLVPEQDWEDPALAASPAGTPPDTASIGFTPGQATGSASPLTWAQAEQVRLTLSLGSSGRPAGPASAANSGSPIGPASPAGSAGAGSPVEQPAVVRARYVDHAPPAAVPVTVTGPADGTVTSGGSVVVSGTTAPRASVSVAATPTDVTGTTTTVPVTADAAGHFGASVPVGYGTNVVTVGVASGSGTGYARLTVVSTALPGTSVLDAADPAGDDHGPGTFRYPTAADFHDGAFDLTDFQVIDAGATIYLRAQLRDLTPTFGSPLGAQLLDVYVRNPAGGTFSTAAPYPQRGYALAADSAWSSRIEVQGFASPVLTGAGGTSLGGVTVTANEATRSILIAVPSAAFGHPASGWTFTVALHGQDGFSPDQARAFAATPQPYQFGLCSPGDTAAVCATDPAAAPKVMDTITPPGTPQSTELDPTTGPVTLHGATVP